MRNDEFLGLSASGFHRVAYTEWGERDNPRVVICVHGLTRNSRDFDFLAAELKRDFRVICPDVVGRGRSDWLAQAQGYNYAQYCADMTALIARAGCAQVDWVGTSMGGLIGMMLAAQPRNPIRRLVMNDIGPFVPKAALQRLAGYVGLAPAFASIAAAERYLRGVLSSFGPLTDAQWRQLTEHSVSAIGPNEFRLRYDPAIADVFAGPLADIDLWPLWERVNCAVLLLRGQDSDVLLRDTAVQMAQRKPVTRLIEFAGVGHAPVLMDREQIEPVREFLTQT